MKLLIWVSTMVILSLINVILENTIKWRIGSILLLNLIIIISTVLCALWDKHTLKRKKNLQNTNDESIKDVDFSASSFKKIYENLLIYFYLVPITSAIISLNLKSYYSNTDVFYIAIAGCCAINMIFQIIKSRKKNNFALYLTTLIFSIISLVPFIDHRIWVDSRFCPAVFKYILIALVGAAAYALYNIYAFVLACINKYHLSLYYRTKCYKKIDIMSEYLKKGIITQEEFDSVKTMILSKINKRRET